MASLASTLEIIDNRQISLLWSSYRKSPLHLYNIKSNALCTATFSRGVEGCTLESESELSRSCQP